VEVFSPGDGPEGSGGEAAFAEEGLLGDPGTFSNSVVTAAQVRASSSRAAGSS
jgi:hypothetical protein